MLLLNVAHVRLHKGEEYEIGKVQAETCVESQIEPLPDVMLAVGSHALLFVRCSHLEGLYRVEGEKSRVKDQAGHVVPHIASRAGLSWVNRGLAPLSVVKPCLLLLLLPEVFLPVARAHSVLAPQIEIACSIFIPFVITVIIFKTTSIFPLTTTVISIQMLPLVVI